MIELAPDLWLFHGQTERDDRDRATRQILAQVINCQPGDIRIEVGISGKPHIASPSGDLYFNRAHRSGWWVLSLGRGQENGVDLEPLPLTQDWTLVAKHLFSVSEYSELSKLPSADQREAFGYLWTGKEAVLKARNLGVVEGVAEPDLSSLFGIGPWPDHMRHQFDTKLGKYYIEWIKHRPALGPALLISRSVPG